MTKVASLGQFLSSANAQFMIFDLGRRVQQIDLNTFEQIEHHHAFYPYPIQGHAQFALVFWTDKQQPFIWFLKMPVDEQGFISCVATTQFLDMVVTALGQNITQPLNQKQQDKLTNHIFIFKPSTEKLAIFNALVRKRLALPPSSQYQQSLNYLSGTINKQEWQQLGLQGIADICVRLNNVENILKINYGFECHIDQVTIALCQCLEHLDIPEKLAQYIFDLFNQCQDLKLKTYYLRALSSNVEYTTKIIKNLDNTNKLTVDVLVTIAARNWFALTDLPCLTSYFDHLALQPQHIFNQIFSDLVAIPLLRKSLLAFIRSPSRSKVLSDAIGGLFKAIKS